MSDKSEPESYCHAQITTSNDPSDGHHVCVLVEGHEGSHECDACSATWTDDEASSRNEGKS